jgi:hypothetical protein
MPWLEKLVQCPIVASHLGDCDGPPRVRDEWLMRLRAGRFSGQSGDQFIERCEALARRGPVAFGVRLDLIEEDANLLAAVAFGYGLHGLSPFARQYSSDRARWRAAHRAHAPVRRDSRRGAI